MTAASPNFFRLSAVTRRIEELLKPALSKTFWVKAEIASAGERRGNFYCELVETDDSGNILAQMRCSIWQRNLSRIREKFTRAGLDLTLEDGTVVGMECQVQFHPRYGLSLSGLDMDPAIALGELELRRRRILEAVTRDGLLELNARRPVPLLPNRIALVTSATSAAYRDFVETLHKSPYGFRVHLADAVMQGPDSERKVLAALDACRQLDIDLIVIVRGGGSKTDLAWLDNEALARWIAACPLPVWTGIGHETDVSVLDHVAGRSHKTPTAVAESLLARFARVELETQRASTRLQASWKQRWRAESEQLARWNTGLHQGSRKLLQMRRSELLAAAEGVRSRVGQRLAREHGSLGLGRQDLRRCSQQRVSELRRALGDARLGLQRGTRLTLRAGRRDLEQQSGRFQLRRILQRLDDERRGLSDRLRVLRAADPQTALARGFTLTYTSKGDLVRSVKALRRGQSTWTRLVDGRLESTIDEIVEEDNA